MIDGREQFSLAKSPTDATPVHPEPTIITTADQVKFIDTPAPFRQVRDVPEYRFRDIRRDDIVIDIGANVGAFALRAAKLSCNVVAVEPICTEILRENIRLNHAAVRVIEGALGDGRPAEAAWDGCRRVLPTCTLGMIIKTAGGCDFLKCDCEGAEWLIDPSDLAGVRRIEMELHIPPICGPPDMRLLDAISRKYDWEVVREPCHGPLGVLGILHARRHT
jgi:hypothetical protein